MYHEAFQIACNRNSVSLKDAGSIWIKIEKAYSGKSRHYHNLRHLENMLTELEAVKPDIRDWDVLIFALGYHDVIYKSTGSENEAQSAELFVDDFSPYLDAGRIAQGKNLILATKGHAKSRDGDTNYFTDADLSILGAPFENYMTYCRQIRKEYSIYPDFIYNKGRRKVLEHFLQMDSIYKTDNFFEKYEAQAKMNLKEELLLY